jgi:hypothetical protein
VFSSLSSLSPLSFLFRLYKFSFTCPPVSILELNFCWFNIQRGFFFEKERKERKKEKQSKEINEERSNQKKERKKEKQSKERKKEKQSKERKKEKQSKERKKEKQSKERKKLKQSKESQAITRTAKLNSSHYWLAQYSLKFLWSFLWLGSTTLSLKASNRTTLSKTS